MGVFLGLAICAGPFLADDWPQWRGPTRDGVWKETGIIDKFPAPQLAIRWRVPIGSGYCGPTSPTAACMSWTGKPDPQEVERVHCLDWKTGRSLWNFSYDCPYKGVGYTAGPRASVSIDDGRVYALGTMGHLHCLDAAGGKLLWKKEPGVDYKVRVPIWGIAAAPLVDGERVIVQIGAAEGACLVALDKRTGAEKWRALDDQASYSAPILIRQAGRRVWSAGRARTWPASIRTRGKVYWKYPFTPEPHGHQRPHAGRRGGPALRDVVLTTAR